MSLWTIFGLVTIVLAIAVFRGYRAMKIAERAAKRAYEGNFPSPH